MYATLAFVIKSQPNRGCFCEVLDDSERVIEGFFRLRRDFP